MQHHGAHTGSKHSAYSSAYLGKSVTVSQEKVVENGVTWALISLNGTQLGLDRQRRFDRTGLIWKCYQRQLWIIRRQSRAARMQSIQRHGA